MRRTVGSRTVALTGLLLVLAGCSEVPITGRKQFNLVPDSIINSMSLQQYGQYISTNKLHPIFTPYPRHPNRPNFGFVSQDSPRL